MKRYLITFVLCAILHCVVAQEAQPAMDDVARIELTAYIDDSYNLPRMARRILKDKMQRIVTKNGMGSANNTRFIMTANIRELNLEKSETAPVIYIYNLEVNFYIGDGIEGTLFSSYSLDISSAGDTKEKAYLAALKKIKTSDPAYQSFIEEGKRKIVDYYTAKCDFIITEAKTKANNQDFDGAIFELISVPEVCKDCYDKCMAEAQAIYQSKIDVECARMLAEARNVWNAGQDLGAADAAGYILSQINPASECYADAAKLSADIAKRVKELDNREWNFMLKQQQDQVDLQKASIKAIRDVGVAYGNHQKPVTYNIRTW